ncbi:MAG: sugar phosphate nucleotidyltransferase [Planctomycetota bacterium]
MKAVILAAGEGRRMRGLCSELPKPMFPLANRPIITNTFDRLSSMGADRVGLVVGHEGRRLQELMGDGRGFGLAITYIWQEEKLGTGHAVGLCEQFVGDEPFVLTWGDVVSHAANYPLIARRYHAGNCDAVLAVFRVPDASATAAVDIEDGRVVGISEKPPPGTRPDAMANAGIFIWPPAIFRCLRDLQPSPRGEYEFTDAIARFVESGRHVAAQPLSGYRENVTDPETCIATNRELLDELLADGACRIAPDSDRGDHVDLIASEVKPGARIGRGCCIGPHVSIGENARVGPGCRIGPNVSIGSNCSVGAQCELSHTILMPGGVLGPASRLDYAIVDSCLRLDERTDRQGAADRVIELLRDELRT